MLCQEYKYSLLWEAYSEDPAKVSPVKRVVSKHKVFLLVNSPSRPDVHEEYSPFQKSNVKYSVIEISPKERLGLTGIEVLKLKGVEALSPADATLIMTVFCSANRLVT